MRYASVMVGMVLLTMELATASMADGHQLVYNWHRGDRHGLSLVTPEADETVLLEGAHRISEPTWFPHGDAVAFACEVSPAHPQLFRLDVADRHLQQLTDLPTGADYPRVSPDGQWIVFRIHEGGQSKLLVMPSAGGTPRPLTTKPADARPGEWIPGTSLYAYLGEANGTAQVWLADVATGTVRQLTTSRHAKAGIMPSPDGRRIAVHKLFVDVATGAESVWYPPIPGVVAELATWNAQGTAIIFVSNVDQKSYEVYRMSPDGTDIHNLSKHPAFDSFPAWSPDGSLIAFSSTRQGPGRYETYVMDPNGGHVQQVTRGLDFQFSRPGWRPQPSGGAGTATPDPEWARQPLWTAGTPPAASVRIDTTEGFRAFTTGGIVREGKPTRWDALDAFHIVLPWTSRDPVTLNLTLRTLAPLQRLNTLRVAVNGIPLKKTLRISSEWTRLTIPLTADQLQNPTPIPYFNNDKLINRITVTVIGASSARVPALDAGSEAARWFDAASRLVRSVGMPLPAGDSDAEADNFIEIQSIAVTPHRAFARIRDETRRAVAVTAPARWDASTTVPTDGARISFGYGLPEEWQPLSNTFVRFAVSVDSEEIWTDTVTPNRESPMLWRDADLDVGRYAGRDVVFRFSVTTDGGTAYAFWSPPVMYRPAQSAAAQRPNVVLVTIDTLRADRFSRDGYPRPTSPTIDTLIAQGVYYPNTIAHSSWTLTSTASIITGLNPMHHGALRDDQRLPNAFTTLPEWFRQAGYATAVIQSNQFLHEQYGFCQGADRYYFDPGATPKHPIRADTQMAYAARWISQFRHQPFFLWLHFMEVHDPYGGYIPPPDITRFGQTDNDKYDAAIRMLDERLGTLRQILREQQVEARTLLIVTSDHGEEFGDHGGTGHGHTLYQEVIRVPLILHWPARLPQGVVVHPMVRHIDLFPTIAELAGLPAPAVDGQSLVPFFQGRPAARPQPAFSWICSSDLKGYILMSILTSDGWKYIQNPNTHSGALYVLTQDPREQHDLSAQHPSKADEMQRLLRAAWHTKTTAESPPVALSQSTKDHLRSLGYFQ